MATLRRRIGKEGDSKSILIIGGSPSPDGASGVTIRLKSKNNGPVLAKGVNLEFKPGGGLVLKQDDIAKIHQGARYNDMSPTRVVTLINRTLATMDAIDSPEKK